MSGDNLLEKDPADERAFPGLSPQERENLRIVMEELKGWDTGDVERVISVMAPDGIYHDMTQPPAQGHAAIREFGHRWVDAVPDFKVFVRKFVVRGDTVVSEGTISGTITTDFWGKPATGRRFELPYCQVAELRDGKIVHIRDYSDSGTLAYQAGWTSKPPYEAPPYSD